MATILDYCPNDTPPIRQHLLEKQAIFTFKFKQFAKTKLIFVKTNHLANLYDLITILTF